MTEQICFNYRGLEIEAEIEDYIPGQWTLSNGDPGYPDEGGTCESFTWDVEDVDEVLSYLELRTDFLHDMVLAFYRMFGRLPDVLVEKLEDEWTDDIYIAAEEEFWRNH